MNKADMLALFDQDQRKDVLYPGMRQEVTPSLVRHVDTTDSHEGAIIYSDLDETNANEMIRTQVAYFESLGQDFEWKVYDYDRPSDLKERLKAVGFLVEEAEAVLVLDLAKAPDFLWQPVRQPLRRITRPEELADIRAVEGQVWDEDFTWIDHYLGEALRNYPDQMSVYIAYVDQRPVSAAWIYFPLHSQFASLFGGSTVPAFRKRGMYTALLAVRAQEARARQVRYLTVDASPMSRPILEKFGFEMLAYTYPCKWKRKTKK